jgi:RHS repeat-associated protein
MSNSLVYRIGPGAYRVVPGQTRTVSLNAQVPVITSNPTVNYFSLSEPENNSICFAGTGLFYFGARYYDPELGIWLSVDPAGQFANAYGYASSHVMMVDPDGELAWFVIPMIVGAVAGAYGGGAAANGSANPADWDFSSGKTWGYMLGGAVIGGASGVLGGAVAGGTTVLPYTGLSIEYG